LSSTTEAIHTGTLYTRFDYDQTVTRQSYSKALFMTMVNDCHHFLGVGLCLSGVRAYTLPPPLFSFGIGLHIY